MRRLLPFLALLLACSRAADRKAHLDPKLARAKAPETFRVKFVTTRGEFLVDVYRDWAPHAVDRFWNLVRIGFFDDCAFFRVTPEFAQFGLTGEKAVNLAWHEAYLPADPPKQSNRRGFVSFAQAGGSPEKRSTQVFVNRGDNTQLDRQFAPFGQVVEVLVEGEPGGNGRYRHGQFVPRPAPLGKGKPGLCLSLPIMSPRIAKGKCPLREGGGHGGENHHEQ